MENKTEELPAPCSRIKKVGHPSTSKQDPLRNRSKNSRLEDTSGLRRFRSNPKEFERYSSCGSSITTVHSKYHGRHYGQCARYNQKYNKGRPPIRGKKANLGRVEKRKPAPKRKSAPRRYSRRKEPLKNVMRARRAYSIETIDTCSVERVNVCKYCCRQN